MDLLSKPDLSHVVNYTTFYWAPGVPTIFYQLLVVESRGYRKTNYDSETTVCPGKRTGVRRTAKSVVSVTSS